MSLHRIVCSAPVDATAARVLRGKGAHWQPQRKVDERHSHWEAPPPAITPRPADAPDFTGVRRDRMTALYWWGRGRWVTRCACGRYELRQAVKWAKNLDLPDACLECRAAHFSRTGRSYGDERSERERFAGGQP